MRIRTDDEVYRVDAVWLGPPKATFPFRARYVAWGVGFLVLLLVLGVERQLGIGFGFFSTAWGLLIAIGLTRLICARISRAPTVLGRDHVGPGADRPAGTQPRGGRSGQCREDYCAPDEAAAWCGPAWCGPARAGRMTTKEDRGVRARA